MLPDSWQLRSVWLLPVTMVPTSDVPVGHDAAGPWGAGVGVGVGGGGGGGGATGGNTTICPSPGEAMLSAPHAPNARMVTPAMAERKRCWLSMTLDVPFVGPARPPR